VLTHLSPVYPSAQPRRYDSALEARFAADLLRATRTWILTREPEPIALGDKLIFPDFELRHVGDPRRRWLVEIVGFWTPAYLTAKLADLRRARLDHLILCVDAARACDASSFPQHAHLVWFKRRIEVREVLAVVDGAGGADVARDA
jgi:hypothetical protein